MSGRTTSLNRDDYEALMRKHVRNAFNWGIEAGTDFWMIVSANGMLGASTTFLISDAGWTATSLALADGAAADFMTAADVGTPPQWTQNAQNDLLKSPAIFGDYTHARQAAILLGKNTLPRYLCGDFMARFSVASGNETTGNVGFVEDGGSIVVAADTLAAFYSNGTNFVLQSGAGASTTVGPAIDTAQHRWRIVFDKAAAVAYGYVDGVAAGSVAIENDEWPAAVGAGSGGATNLVQLNQAHIWYAYKDPRGGLI